MCDTTNTVLSLKYTQRYTGLLGTIKGTDKIFHRITFLIKFMNRSKNLMPVIWRFLKINMQIRGCSKYTLTVSLIIAFTTVMLL